MRWCHERLVRWRPDRDAVEAWDLVAAWPACARDQRKRRTLGRGILIYCAIDWAERTNDVALVDDTGQLLAKRHITDDAASYKNLLELLAEYSDTAENPIPIAIETSRGLLVAVLRTGNRKVFAINPMAAARYRDRHSSPARSPTPATPWSSPTSSAPTCTPTGLCLTTPTSAARSRSWPEPSMTLCGTGSSSPTSSAP